MNETASLFAILRNFVDQPVADAIETLVRDGSDRELCRVNALSFAERHSLDEERTIAGFLHAASLGLFEISWNVLCPGCGGVLETNASLKTVIKEEYVCALCSAGYSPTLDELVEVTFTVNPRVRRIAGHNPHELPMLEYLRQMYWGSGVALPEENYEEVMDTIVLDSLEVPAGEKAVISLQFPAKFIIVFDAVTHTVQFVDVKGEPTKERQSIALVYDRGHAHSTTLEMRPGPVRISIENRTDARVLPAVFIADDELHDLLLKRRPFLTAKPSKPGRKDACILRVTPRVKKHAGADRGAEAKGERDDFPWLFAEDSDVGVQDFPGGAGFKGRRYNDFHYTRAFKQRARDARSKK